MFLKKGKRKITVNKQLFYWCVTSESEIEPLILSIFSEEKYLFSIYYEYGNIIRTPYKYIYADNEYEGYSLTFEKITEITPATVRKNILNYLAIRK